MRGLGDFSVHDSKLHQTSGFCVKAEASHESETKCHRRLDWV